MTKKMSGWACTHIGGFHVRGVAQEAKELAAKGAAKKGVKRPDMCKPKPVAPPAERRPVKGKTAGIPFRQERAPVPLMLSEHLTLSEVTALVARRVHQIGRARSCCAYVFVREGQVFVLSEESTIAHRWAVNFTAEWVGCYGGLVDQDVLAQDLGELL